MKEHRVRHSGSAVLRAAVVLVAALLVGATQVTPAAAKGERATRTFRAVKALESSVLAEINAVRARHGLAAVHLSRPLSAAATRHTLDMGRRGFFEHNAPGGETFRQRVSRFYGPESYSRWAIGENLLWASQTIDANAALVAWMKSPTHRKNLLTPEWREVGLSAVFVPAAPGAFGGSDVTIIATEFGIRR